MVISYVVGVGPWFEMGLLKVYLSFPLIIATGTCGEIASIEGLYVPGPGEISF